MRISKIFCALRAFTCLIFLLLTIADVASANESPPAPTLTSPQNGSVITSATSVTLRWYLNPDSDGDVLESYLAIRAIGDSWEPYFPGKVGRATSYTFTDLKPNTTYEWSVAAVDWQQNSWSWYTWSEDRTFTTASSGSDTTLNFIFPLSGLYSPNRIGGYHHGDHWLNKYCNNHPDEYEWRLRHIGIDLSAIPEQNVYAAEAGRIKVFRTDGKWGGYIVIEGQNEFATTYTHVIPRFYNYSSGDLVEAGDLIATIADGKNYLDDEGKPRFDSHLHFSIRKEYDASIVLRGRLPNVACFTEILGSEPAFPEQFIDPEKVNWTG